MTQSMAIPSPFHNPESQLKKEQTLATLHTQCPELTDIVKNHKDQDPTAVLALLALNRLVEADPVELRWEINLCTTILRQRVASGMLGEIKANDMLQHLHNPPITVARIYVDAPRRPEPEMLDRLRQFGFFYDESESKWWAFETPQTLLVADEIHTKQMDVGVI